jgi:hypothetical protein
MKFDDPAQPDLKRFERRLPVHAEGATGVVEFPVSQTVPAQLLDGGETVLFAVKPSAWFVPIVSHRWLVVAIGLIVLSYTVFSAAYGVYAFQGALILAGGRLGWATLEWVGRLYVLTNRRVMSIRGVVSAEIYAAPLHGIEKTRVYATPPERACRVGSVEFESASTGRGAWEAVARPVDMHDRLQHAIQRSRNANGLG